MTFHLRSYERHVAHLQEELDHPERQRMHEAWFRQDTADFWRHQRMYRAVDCLLGLKDATWLTVGDGRFGLDAIRLKKKGFRDVLPSDISDGLLRPARERGLIERYAVENAERLSFGDESFDFVFCKETYHHCPRPMVALYEMLRVARQAVVLVEPHDWRRSMKDGIHVPPLRRLPRIVASRCWHLAKGLVGKGGAAGRSPSARRKSRVFAEYEEVGNYVYALSSREIIKAALALNLPAVAFRRFNDFHVKGCEFEPASWRSPVYRKMRLTILRRDLLARLAIRQSMHIMAIIFKRPIEAGELGVLRKDKWEVLELPRNPHA